MYNNIKNMEGYEACVIHIIVDNSLIQNLNMLTLQGHLLIDTNTLQDDA